uniref:uncharacterized protein LOC100176842 isoform X1 n=1 Tax=Ciona intestinalis TaxID=7719 RepID=UPI000EF51727|nr:uncharacterized protein LOC100176842 isoform X1 [Ciona intestinalis]|eukprot:XP_026693034.1 uncharacterized protein LOC100176842 isoform X1 [Ciona intestinalis]
MSQLVKNSTIFTKIHIGVLAVQGNFAEHKASFQQAIVKLKTTDFPYKVEISEIRRTEEIDDALDGLVIPGGETPTMTVALRRNGFFEKLKAWTQRKDKYTWGTCAGLILLSNKLDGDGKGEVIPIGGLDITCRRNAKGRQFESFEESIRLTDHELCALNRSENFHGIFIRAPGIKSVDDVGTDVLCVLPGNGEVVGVRKGNLMGCTFHPELTGDSMWHEYFIKMVGSRKS